MCMSMLALFLPKPLAVCFSLSHHSYMFFGRLATASAFACFHDFLCSLTESHGSEHLWFYAFDWDGESSRGRLVFYLLAEMYNVFSKVLACVCGTEAHRAIDG